MGETQPITPPSPEELAARRAAAAEHEAKAQCLAPYVAKQALALTLKDGLVRLARLQMDSASQYQVQAFAGVNEVGQRATGRGLIGCSVEEAYPIDWVEGFMLLLFRSPRLADHTGLVAPLRYILVHHRYIYCQYGHYLMAPRGLDLIYGQGWLVEEKPTTHVNQEKTQDASADGGGGPAAGGQQARPAEETHDYLGDIAESEAHDRKYGKSQVEENPNHQNLKIPHEGTICHHEARLFGYDPQKVTDEIARRAFLERPMETKCLTWAHFERAEVMRNAKDGTSGVIVIALENGKEVPYFVDVATTSLCTDEHVRRLCWAKHQLMYPASTPSFSDVLAMARADNPLSWVSNPFRPAEGESMDSTRAKDQATKAALDAVVMQELDFMLGEEASSINGVLTGAFGYIPTPDLSWNRGVLHGLRLLAAQLTGNKELLAYRKELDGLPIPDKAPSQVWPPTEWGLTKEQLTTKLALLVDKWRTSGQVAGAQHMEDVLYGMRLFASELANDHELLHMGIPPSSR